VEDLPGARGILPTVRGPRSSLINNLVYPLPHSDGLSLGVHFTKTLWGTFFAGADGDVRRRKRQLREKPIADCGFRAQRENAFAGD